MCAHPLTCDDKLDRAEIRTRGEALSSPLNSLAHCHCKLVSMLFMAFVWPRSPQTAYIPDSTESIAGATYNNLLGFPYQYVATQIYTYNVACDERDIVE